MDPPPNSGPIRLTGAFVLARRLSTRLIVRRGLVLASVALLERVLIPVAAWAVFWSSLVEKARKTGGSARAR